MLSFNTLAESGTRQNTQTAPEALLIGEGTAIKDNASLTNRAKRKIITQKVILSLIDMAKAKGDFERVQVYWNAYHCQEQLISSGGRLYGKYCKNSCCTLCCAIRKADIINRYYPTLIQWQDLHFVTLTAKSVEADQLQERIYKMYRNFNLIKNRCNKRYQRGKNLKLMGIKSLECNFNPMAKTYNPHLHIIVANKEMGEILIKDWLTIWPRKYAKRVGQDIKQVYDLENNLVEIIKYGSKIFTEPDVNKKSKSKVPRQIYVAALYNILEAMKGRRIFDRFGFNLPKQEKPMPKITMLKQYEELEFNPKIADWQNVYSGEVLSGYIPPSQLTAILEHGVNTTLE